MPKTWTDRDRAEYLAAHPETTWIAEFCYDCGQPFTAEEKAAIAADNADAAALPMDNHTPECGFRPENL